MSEELLRVLRGQDPVHAALQVCRLQECRHPDRLQGPLLPPQAGRRRGGRGQARARAHRRREVVQAQHKPQVKATAGQHSLRCQRQRYLVSIIYIVFISSVTAYYKLMFQVVPSNHSALLLRKWSRQLVSVF